MSTSVLFFCSAKKPINLLLLEPAHRYSTRDYLASRVLWWTGGKMSTRWALKDARTMTSGGRALALDPLSAVNNISRDPSWGKQIERWMNFIDERRLWNIFHLRV